MASKWIKELEDVYFSDDGWESLLPILERINRLLKVAGIQSEDPNISDRIQKETEHISGKPKKKKKEKEHDLVLTGKSKLEFLDEEEVEKFIHGD